MCKRNSRTHRKIRRSNHPVIGYHYLHTAIDDRSRLAYSELLADECKDTAAAFWKRANAWFTKAGITVTAVLSDNGACYRSRPFAEALGGISHKRTRPYRPHKRTARWSASTEPISTNGPMPRPTAATPNEAKRSRLGCTPTITTAATPHSAANHQQAVSPTSQVSTPRPGKRLRRKPIG
jgi:transposase InsO family protein